ncbi:hypothetical protein Tsubulata_033140 [Turnera subulata]|uniref:DUF4283 domain-containing protein n=1 Tax=Turnera subulata TaxID=218843 RepID=A0A9Q0J163_9ROSI|nr:hypothetical protein Tsubulata_033140 [Turnera subulata]
MASSSVIDATGLHREKSALVMDLGGLILPKSTLGPINKGKAIATPIRAPVSFVSVESHGAPVVYPSGESLLTHGALPSSSGNPVEASTNIIAPTKDSTISPIPQRNVTWAKVVSPGIISAPDTLDFVEPVLAADNATLCIPPELLAIGKQKYSLCLIGQFMGNTPRMGLIHAMLNKLWGRQGVISVSDYKEGLILIQFPTDASLSRALMGGPWHVAGVPLILRPWESNLQKLDFTNATLPVWVQLKQVPYELLKTIMP